MGRVSPVLDSPPKCIPSFLQINSRLSSDSGHVLTGRQGPKERPLLASVDSSSDRREVTTAPVQTVEALELLDTEGLRLHAGLHAPWLSPPPAPRRPLTSCGRGVGVEPPVHGVLEVNGRLPAARSCARSGKGETAQYDTQEGRGALSKRRLQRHTRPLSQRGSTCLLSLLAAQCSCDCLSASRAPVSSHATALPPALAPPAPSARPAAPARGSSSALQPEDRWGWSPGGPASPRHTQSQLTPEQGACSSSVLRAPLTDSSLQYG